MANNDAFDDFDVNMAVRYNPDIDDYAWQHGTATIDDYFRDDAPFWTDELPSHDAQPPTAHGGEMISHGDPTNPGNLPGFNNVSTTPNPQVGQVGGGSSGNYGDGNMQQSNYGDCSVQQLSYGDGNMQQISYGDGNMHQDNISAQINAASQTIPQATYAEPFEPSTLVANNNLEPFSLPNESVSDNQQMHPQGSYAYAQDMPHHFDNSGAGILVQAPPQPMPHSNYPELLSDEAAQPYGIPVGMQAISSTVPSGSQYPYDQARPYDGPMGHAGIRNAIRGQGLFPLNDPTAPFQTSSQYPYNLGASYGNLQAGGQAGIQYPFPNAPPSSPIDMNIYNARSSQATLVDPQLASTPYQTGRHTHSTPGAQSLRREMQQQIVNQRFPSEPIPFPTLTIYATPSPLHRMAAADPAVLNPRKRRHGDGDTQRQSLLANEATQPSRRRRAANTGPMPAFPHQNPDNNQEEDEDEDTVLPTTETGFTRVATHVRIPKPRAESTADSGKDMGDTTPTQTTGGMMTDPSTGASGPMLAKRKKRATQSQPKRPSLLSSGSAMSQMISDTASAGNATTDATSDRDTDSEAGARPKRLRQRIADYEYRSLRTSEDSLTLENTKPIGRRTTRSTVALEDLLASGPNAGEAAKKRHAEK